MRYEGTTVHCEKLTRLKPPENGEAIGGRPPYAPLCELDQTFGLGQEATVILQAMVLKGPQDKGHPSRPSS